MDPNFKGKEKDKNLNFYVDVGTWGVEEARNLRISVHVAKKSFRSDTKEVEPLYCEQS